MAKNSHVVSKDFTGNTVPLGRTDSPPSTCKQTCSGIVSLILLFLFFPFLLLECFYWEYVSPLDLNTKFSRLCLRTQPTLRSLASAAPAQSDVPPAAPITRNLRDDDRIFTN